MTELICGPVAMRLHTVVGFDSMNHLRQQEPVAIVLEGVFYPSLAAASAGLELPIRAVEHMAWEKINGRP